MIGPMEIGVILGVIALVLVASSGIGDGIRGKGRTRG